MLISYTLNVSAQQNLSIKGVPITGGMRAFISQLEAKGLKKTSGKGLMKQQKLEVKAGRLAFMKGELAGLNDCEFEIQSNGKNVFIVTVKIDTSKKGNSDAFGLLARNLEQKYGDGRYEDHTEGGATIKKTDDGTAEGAIEVYKHQITSGGYFYETSRGTISLSLVPIFNKDMVFLIYADKQSAMDKVEVDSSTIDEL